MAARSRGVALFAFGVAVFGLVPCAPGHAQNQAIDDLKGKIFDAKMAREQLGTGARFCQDLNGKGFYFHLRDRVLNLEEYLHSLENLAKAEVYNPEKKRPWSLQDAKERWEVVKQQAADDKQKCELMKSLPQMEKHLQELEAAAPDKNPDKNAGADKGVSADKSAGADKKD
jgi:tRNA nucleotidyltransferase/poly(A) polymerase